MSDFHVAIIGAGLSGLALALALHEQSIACTLYEARDAPLDTGGGLMLTPNGLKVLQGVGIYDSLVDQAYTFDKVFVQNGKTGAIVESLEYGNAAKYGMSALRAFRYTVLELLLKKVQSKGIPIRFNSRYSHIVSETHEKVTWEFTDGSTSSASILVGADGIHSTVRKYLAPDVEPKFGGFITLVAAVPTAQLELPAEDTKHYNRETNKHPLPSGIIVPSFGAFVSAPQTKEGDDLMITVMRPFPHEPEKWGPIDDDKDRLRAMFRENVNEFPEVVQKAVADIPDGQLRVWPGYSVPLLESWTSFKKGTDRIGRVVILGDAAHAIPPHAGQGANQAFEDVHLFAGVLGKLEGDYDPERLRKALRGWQIFRQERVDRVIRLNKQMELMRLPAAERKDVDPESVKGSMSEDFDALFKIDLGGAVEECLRRVDGV